jgi:hypothetical protein
MNSKNELDVISQIAFSESKEGFPGDYFYLKISPNYVLDVKRNSIFFGFGGASIKEGSNPIIASKKSEADNDGSYQLWRHENGYLVNKQTNLYLGIDNGKVLNSCRCKKI